MKKLFCVVTATGFVLALMTVFPGISSAEDNDSKSEQLYNGVTTFEKWTEAEVKPAPGSAAGGTGEKSARKEPYNGVTFFDTNSGSRIATKDDVAWGKQYNGVTSFE